MRQLTTLIFLSFLFFISFNLSAQNIFERTYSQNTGNQIEQTDDGGFLLKGSDFVTKTDANGNELWSKTIDPMDGFNTTSDGGFIKIATIEVNDPNNTHTDVLLTKTDENDQVLWSVNVGDWMSEIPSTVMQASDGGYLIGGSTDLRDPTTGVTIANRIICLIKTDANGIMEWKQSTIAGSSEVEVLDSKVIETSNAYVVGGSGFNSNNPQARSIILMQTSKDGSLNDLHIVQDSNTRYILNHLAPTNFGSYLMAGSKMNFSVASNVTEMYVAKRGGQFEWTYCKGDGSNFYNGASWANAVTEDSNGNIFIAGSYSGTGGDSFYSAQGRATLIKLNQEGQEQWLQNYPKNSNDVIATTDGGLAFVGSKNGQLKLAKLTTEQIGIGCRVSNPDYKYLGDYAGSSYYLSYLEENWETASATAYFLHDNNLVTIETEEENAFIQSLIDEPVFIGISDASDENEWEWIDGSPVDYTNFSTCDFCGLDNDDNDYGKINPWDGSWSFDNQWVARKAIMEVKCGNSNAISTQCPTDLYLIRDQDFVPGIILDWDLPIAETTCSSGNLTFEQIAGPSRGSYVFEANAFVTYLITDDCGNIETCSFYLEVKGGDPCPTQFEGFTFLGNVDATNFFISNEKVAPKDFENLDLPEFATLATVSHPGDLGVINQNWINESVYIGLNDVDSEGDLAWANGDPVDYTNFDICSFCVANSEDNDYVVMNPWDGTWSWSNQYAARRYVIELSCLPFYMLSDDKEEEGLSSIDTKKEAEAVVSEQLKLQSIYPNPVDEFVYVKLDSPIDEQFELRIVSLQGRIYENKTIQLQKGVNEMRIETNQLPKGMYFIQIPSLNSSSPLRFLKM